MWLSLLGRFWWAIPLIAAALWIAGLRADLSHKENELAVVRGDLASAKAIGAAQTKRAESIQATWVKAVGDITDASNAKLKAVAADRDSLSARLRDAELRASQVPGAASGATRDAGAPGEPAAASGVDPALDAYDKACQRDAIRLEWWQRRAEAMTEGAPPH